MAKKIVTKQAVCLINRYALGDNVVSTAAIRDLVLAHPHKYDIFVETLCTGVWTHNPYIRLCRPPASAIMVSTNYANYIRPMSRQSQHFQRVYYKQLEEALNIEIPVTLPHGDLYLTAEQKAKPPVIGNYWVALCGGKVDAITKLWPATYWQTTIDNLKQNGIHIVQTGLKSGGCNIQPKLNNVLDLVGWGKIRELLWLIWHSDGVICPITSGMHIAAAFSKPCVVIAGGREHFCWEAYTNHDITTQFGPTCKPLRVNHTYLHTIGQYSCCKNDGCWAKNVELETVTGQNCKKPIKIDNIIAPRCMWDVTPQMVVEAVLGYNTPTTVQKPKFN